MHVCARLIYMQRLSALDVHAKLADVLFVSYTRMFIAPKGS